MALDGQITAAQAPRGALLARPVLAGLPLPVILLMVALILPFILNLGGLRLSAYRLILIALLPVLIVQWLGGGAGRIRVADLAVVLLCCWATLSFAVVHGIGTGLEAGGIFFVETLGAYLLARLFIRCAEAFRAMVRLLFWIVLLLLPFALFEALTGRNLLLEIMNSIWPSYRRVAKDPRWGLDRVQATFEHPILFGVFCGAAIGLTHFVLGHGQATLRRFARTAMVFVTAALALSAGPLTGMVAQFQLIAWNTIFARFKGRWALLAGLVAAMLIFLELAATRSAPAIFIDNFSFNRYSAYMRIHIWGFGTASILAHPVFGIGFNDWARPSWMSSSIDMFWIVHGVRHGMPAMALTFVAFFAVYLPLAFRRGLDRFQSDCRLGLLVSLTALFLMGWTVHYWNATYVLFMFLLGSGMWLLDARPGEGSPDRGDSDPRASGPRFVLGSERPARGLQGVLNDPGRGRADPGG